ncbi:solute:sodium symporter family transporter [Marinococcus halophilus]|uniref:Solute:sodium symporter family transporter n=1 Tax=Marinococcus halophilus TaxID=1371 RepID=A0A510Y6U1_MARHA|nr:solute:sodium symporter family transporter [Marinococcus halophilus]OZT79722.1 solute:sodium symporter family transporter [Marinococcus halophilus]GEK59078.1 solute:sodium symporter family transporter [Marinococcus halophilus]
MILTIASCIFFMALVAWISYRKTRNQVSNSDGYFLAGRGLTGGFIAGSLLLTNLSAEQLIGLNGQAYSANLSNMAWEVTAAFAVIILALFLLPKYLGGAFTTLPQFLRSRFDSGVQTYVVMLFMLGYAFVTIPSVLYSGGLAVLQLFEVPELLGISLEQGLWLVVWTIGIIGACYAIFGGLRAVAISDTLNGIGLIIVGLLIPVLGFIALGNGNMLEGMRTITLESPEKLNAIGSSDDAVPVGTIFTGMIFMNLFYWGTNQYVIQRTLGAKSLAEGQKGALFTGFYKLLVPLMMMIPGIIAFHLYGEQLNPIDLAYPTLIANVMPTFLNGFFLAVLLGAVFSSFNSLLNSASTMFAYDIYKAWINKNATDTQMIRISKWFGTFLAMVTFFIAPLLLRAPDGLWNLIREFTGFFNIPIIAIVLVGILTKRVPPLGPKIAIIFHVVTYYFLLYGVNQFFGYNIEINFIYISFVLFLIEVGIMLSAGKFKPLPEDFEFHADPKVNMTPWKYALPVTTVLLSAVAFTYLVFSPWGVAYTEGIVSSMFLPMFLILFVVTVIIYIVSLKSWNKKYEEAIQIQHDKAVEKTNDKPVTKL